MRCDIDVIKRGLDLFQKTAVIWSIRRYRSQAGVWSWQILNQVLESQLFAYLWNRYHRWCSDFWDRALSDQCLLFSVFSRINRRFTAGKRFGVWEYYTYTKQNILTSVGYAFYTVCAISHVYQSVRLWMIYDMMRVQCKTLKTNRKLATLLT
jgi:hypothetical protein